jgi:hypothetical protein
VFIAEAFGGWLIGQLANAGGKRLGAWLLGHDQEQALRQAATAAIQAIALQLRPEPTTLDDVQGADHLALVPRQATFARSTISRNRRSWALRFRQAM